MSEIKCKTTVNYTFCSDIFQFKQNVYKHMQNVHLVTGVSIECDN